jgi:hypothetical protein
LRLDEEVPLDAQVEFNFQEMVHRLQKWTEEQDSGAIDGAIVCLIPRHSDATEGGVVTWFPEEHDDTDTAITVRELFTTFCWAIMAMGVTPEDVKETVEQAIHYFDTAGIKLGTTEDGAN